MSTGDDWNGVGFASLAIGVLVILCFAIAPLDRGNEPVKSTTFTTGSITVLDGETGEDVSGLVANFTIYLANMTGFPPGRVLQSGSNLSEINGTRLSIPRECSFNVVGIQIEMDAPYYTRWFVLLREHDTIFVFYKMPIMSIHEMRNQ